jgi:hypothetical protein
MYVRAFGLIIAGIIGVVFCLTAITKSIEDFSHIKGVISKSQLRWNKAPYDIQINNKKWFFVYYKKYFPILREKAVEGKKATIWHDESNRIKQLKIEGEIIYPYNKPIWMYLILGAFGLVLAVGNIIYVIKYPSHLEGKDKKIPETMDNDNK